MKRPLVIVGAGGFGRETAEAVRAVNTVAPTWELLGFLDDGLADTCDSVDGVRVLGPIDAMKAFDDALVVVSTGNPTNYFSRRAIVARLDLSEARYARVVHPAAVVPPSCELGPGSVVLAGVVATTAVRVGAHVALMPNVVLTHDDVIGDFATFGAGVTLSGAVRVGDGAYVGAGALVREHRRIGAWSLVGMGSVVTHDVPDREVWAGVPARFLRRVEGAP